MKIDLWPDWDRDTKYGAFKIPIYLNYVTYYMSMFMAENNHLMGY